jgi:hypothetical protein
MAQQTETVVLQQDLSMPPQTDAAQINFSNDEISKYNQQEEPLMPD